MKVEGVLLPADEVDVDDNRGMAFFPFSELTTHILNEIIEGNIGVCCTLFESYGATEEKGVEIEEAALINPENEQCLDHNAWATCAVAEADTYKQDWLVGTGQYHDWSSNYQEDPENLDFSSKEDPEEALEEAKEDYARFLEAKKEAYNKLSEAAKIEIGYIEECI